jgi:hypothetical protein
VVNSCPVQSARASDRDGRHTASFPEDNARRPQNSMKPGRTVLAQILDYLWVVIANDNVHTEFRHAPGDRLLLQLGMWLKRPLSVRCQAVHRGCFERSPLEVGGDQRIRMPRLSSRPVRSGHVKSLTEIPQYPGTVPPGCRP